MNILDKIKKINKKVKKISNYIFNFIFVFIIYWLGMSLSFLIWKFFVKNKKNEKRKSYWLSYSKPLDYKRQF